MQEVWTADSLAAALLAEDPVRHEQIAGLLTAVSSPEHAVVLSFVLMQSSGAAAALANAMGYRANEAGGAQPYCATKVVALVRNGHPTVPQGLLELARQGLPPRWYRVRYERTNRGGAPELAWPSKPKLGKPCV